MTTNINTRQLVANDQRAIITADLFGVYFPIQLEPFIFSMASRLSEDYGGGSWFFWKLGNGAFYMAPDSEGSSSNQPEWVGGFMSADAFGVAVCLFAFSHLSFDEGAFALTCSDHFHLLLEYALDHAEARAILAATD